MFVALLLLLQAGSSPGWPVSSRVVDELLPLLNDSQGDIGRVAGELVDSGNEGLAYRVLNAYGKRWKDSRFLLFRRAGRIDDLIRLVDGYYPDNSKYPELIRDALDYPSRGNTDRALAFLDSEIRAGRDGGLGMKDVDKDLDRQELFFKFCSLLRDQSHWDEMFYAADRTLDKKWLGFLLRTFPRMYGGDVPGPYDDSLRPIFSGSIDRLITKHPDMFEDEDLIRFAGLLGSPAMVRTAVDRLLNKAAYEPVEPSPTEVGRNYDDLMRLVSRLVEQGDIDVAKRIVEKEAPFIVSSFRHGLAGTPMHGAKNIAEACDSALLDKIYIATRAYILGEDADMLAFTSRYSLDSPVELLYFAGRKSQMSDLIALAEDRRPGISQGYLYELLGEIGRARKYDDLFEIGFKYCSDYVGYAIWDLTTYDSVDVEKLLDSIESHCRTEAQFRQIVRSLDTFAGQCPVGRLTRIVKGAYPELPDDLSVSDAMKAITAYCSLDEEGLAKPIIDRVVNADVSKWDPVNLLFATTRGKVASTGWLTESVMTKILDHVRSENADSPGAIPWFLVTVLKYAKDDEALQQRAIELFSNEYAKVYAQEPGIKFSILEDLINSNVGDPLFNGPDFLDLPISVTLQDRLVDIMEKAG